MTFLRSFRKDDGGQDIVEYTLLLAFVALASAALVLGFGDGATGIWLRSNTNLTSANSVIN